MVSLNNLLRDFPGGPVAKTSPFNAGCVCLIPGPGAMISHAFQPKSQYMKWKQYCITNSTKTFKMFHIKRKILPKKKSLKNHLLKSFGPKHYFMEGDWVRWYKTHELHYVKKSMPRSDSGQRSFHLEKTWSACTLPVNMHGVAATSLIQPGKMELQVICVPCQEKAKEAEKWLVGRAIWLPLLCATNRKQGCRMFE